MFNSKSSISQSISSSNGVTTINVNGKKVFVKGDNISVCNGKIFVDGKEYKDDDVFKENYTIQNVIIEGDVGSIGCKGNISIKGDVYGSVNCGGNVFIDGEHKGSIDCGGNVNIGTFVR